MKKILSLFITLLFSNLLIAQVEFESSIGANFLSINKLNISDNPIFDGNSNFIGATYSPQWNINDFIIGFDFNLSYSRKKTDSIQINQTAFIVSFLVGEKFRLGDGINFKLLGGYSFGGFGLNSSVEHSINYNSANIDDNDKSISVINNSHYLTAKLQTELFDLMLVSFTYHLSLVETEWRGTYSTLTNAPSDKFNCGSVTIGFVF